MLYKVEILKSDDSQLGCRSGILPRLANHRGRMPLLQKTKLSIPCHTKISRFARNDRSDTGTLKSPTLDLDLSRIVYPFREATRISARSVNAIDNRSPYWINHRAVCGLTLGGWASEELETTSDLQHSGQAESR
jgi:hypothetical protein